MSDLRTATHEATRRRILDATQELVAEVHGWTLTMTDVAERAGVSRRTLYRYFADRDELLEAASEEWSAPPTTRPPTDLDGLGEWLAGQWRAMADDVPALKAQHQSPAGRQSRARFLPRARAMVDAVVAEASVDGLTREEAVDVLLVLASSSTFLELVDRMGHAPDRAAHMVATAAHAMLWGSPGRGAQPDA